MGELIRFSPLPTIKELLKLYNLKAMKELSQNFILDLRVTNKIVQAAGDLTDGEVCEVGPGPGGITRSILLTHARKVYGIEKDERFRPILEALQDTVKNRFEVIYADVLDFNFTQLFDSSLKKDWEDTPPNIHIIGNLPFNIANPLLIKYLKDISLRRNAWSFGRVKMTLTFQEEVARRITSEILSKYRCRLSVMCQNWCKVKHKFTIKGSAFLPKPDVNVGIVHIEPLVRPIIDMEFEVVEKVLRVIFNNRQKYAKNPARNLFPQVYRSELVKELFDLADLEPTSRPFEFSAEDWLKICLAYKHICDREPTLYNYDFRGPKATREDTWMNNSKLAVN